MEGTWTYVNPSCWNAATLLESVPGGVRCGMWSRILVDIVWWQWTRSAGDLNLLKMQ